MSVSQYESQMMIKAGLQQIEQKQIAELCKVFTSQNPGFTADPATSSREGSYIILRDRLSRTLRTYYL